MDAGVLTYAGPEVLDYRPPAPAKSRTDRVVLTCIGLLSGLLATGVLVGTVEVWIKTWPSFGMTLIAAPSGIVATAFGSIAWAAIRAARATD